MSRNHDKLPIYKWFMTSLYDAIHLKQYTNYILYSASTPIIVLTCNFLHWYQLVQPPKVSQSFVGCGDPILFVPETIGRSVWVLSWGLLLGVFDCNDGRPSGVIDDVDETVGLSYTFIVVDSDTHPLPTKGTWDKLMGIPGLRGYTGVTHLTGGGP
ncbi:hypothetical protein EDB86DRAFT_2836297 [Lactarius hatsudake]|nr:hypothetical protein EDB86DRAFT_2836297 [Lactarius hatsudake]